MSRSATMAGRLRDAHREPGMSTPFFNQPILNSPYEYPRRHCELDEAGQPTQKIIETRRAAKFITPIPKPKKRKPAAQTVLLFNGGKGLSTKEQQYDPTSIINEVRGHVDACRPLSPSQWQVTPETARLCARAGSSVGHRSRSCVRVLGRFREGSR
jgi:type III restriction enzyme